MFKNLKNWCNIFILTGLFFILGSNLEARTITDTAGNQVELNDNIERIGIVPIPWASIVYAIDGSDEKIVGINSSAKAAYNKSILKKLAPKLADVETGFVGEKFAINMEESAKLKIDAMIVWDHQDKEIELLKSIGIPAIALKYGTLEDLTNGMKVVGEVLNKQDRAKKFIDYIEKDQEYFKTKEKAVLEAKKPKVLYLRDATLKVAGKKAANTLWLNMAGGENVSGEVAGQWVNVTMEQIMAWDPEIIIMSNFSDFTPDEILENKIKGQDWSQITAVKNKKVLKAPMGIYRWDAPSIETTLMIKWLGTQVQPEIFKDIDMEKELKSFYKEYFNYDLNKDELNSILNK